MKKYRNLLFTKVLLLAMLPMLLVTSCNEDVLTETPLDFLAPENAYNSIPGIQQGIAGLHFIVRWAFYTDTGNQDFFAIWTGGVGSDIAFHGENPGGNRKLVNYQSEMTSENVQFRFLWETSYRLIQRANTLIAGIENSSNDIWAADPSKKNQYLAEARFFRAWAYSNLVAVYGAVPLVLDKISTAKIDFVRNTVAEVQQAMVDDLTFAGANLPLPNAVEGPGRVNQKAAWHKLSEVYLSMGRYQDAVTAASQVINNYGSALMTRRFGSTIEAFGSGDPILDLFSYGNQNLAENTEAIWVIQFEPLITGGAQFAGERGWGPAYFRMGNTPDGFPAFRGELVNGVYTGYSDTLGRPVAWTKPTNYAAYFIWHSDWNNDMRNAKHHIKRDFFFDNPNSAFHGKKIDFKLYPPGTRNSLNDTCQYIFPYFLKHTTMTRFTNPATSGQGYNHKDFYAMRLAETYLLRAEAYLGLNNKTAAAADINVVRARANATPVSAANVDIDYLLDERARELYGEEFRHVTLRRTGKFLERVRKYNNNPIYPACNVQDHNVLWPIPQNQIDLNLDATIAQNPGY